MQPVRRRAGAIEKVATQRIGQPLRPQVVDEPLVLLADDQLEVDAALIRLAQDSVDAGGATIVEGQVAVHTRRAQQLRAEGTIGAHFLQRHRIDIGGAAGSILEGQGDVVVGKRAGSREVRFRHMPGRVAVNMRGEWRFRRGFAHLGPAGELERYAVGQRRIDGTVDPFRAPAHAQAIGAPIDQPRPARVEAIEHDGVCAVETQGSQAVAVGAIEREPGGGHVAVGLQRTRAPRLPRRAPDRAAQPPAEEVLVALANGVEEIGRSVGETFGVEARAVAGAEEGRAVGELKVACVGGGNGDRTMVCGAVGSGGREGIDR